MKSKLFFFLKLAMFACLMALCPASMAQFGGIAFIGSQTDLGSGWRTASVIKPLDLDSNNVVGTDGYYMVNIAPVLPDYLSQATTLSSTFPGDSGYAMIDNPTDLPNLFTTGTINPTPGTGNSSDLFAFTVNGNAAGRKIRVGLMVDNLDDSGFNAASLEVLRTNGIQGTSGPVPTTSAVFNDQVPDWLFFDILTPAAGDTFIIRAVGGAYGVATLAGVAFDSLPVSVVTSARDSGPGSLRYVIPNTAAGGIIAFAPSLAGATIVLTNGELLLATNVTIDASSLPGGMTINGHTNSRIFEVYNGGATVTTVILNSLTITNGVAPNSGGGGGILNQGNLIMNQCTIAGNSATVGGSGSGGGIYWDSGAVTMNQCALSGNSAVNYGGAIRSGGGSLTLNNCTLSGNSVSSGGGAGIYMSSTSATLTQCTIASNNAGSLAGAIFSSSGSALTLNQCTVTANSASIRGGIYSFGSLTLNNSIVAGNSASGIGADIFANSSTVTYGGSNLVEDVFGATSGPAPLVGAPVLSPLGNYGGPMQTMPPLPGSPAIDASGSTTLAIDQRGFPRVIGPAPDLGAAEFFYPSNPVVTNIVDGGMGALRDIVNHSLAGYTVTFAPTLSGQIVTLTNGLVILSNNVSIDASALTGGVTVSGNNASGIFSVGFGATVSLVGLTLANGNQYDGGAVYGAHGSMLNISRCTFTGNSAVEGGALCNDGALQIENSTFSGNYGSFGGALECRGPATLINCTLSANNGYYCGGIYNKDTTLTLNNCIIAANTDASEPADIYSENATLVLTNANLIQNLGSDGISPPPTGPAPLTSAPKLAALGNYGGPTQTMPPLPGSPAIDAGNNYVTNYFSIDQRGFSRVLGAVVDLGAVEGIFNPAGPGRLTGVNRSGNGTVQFGFTNYTDTSFTVLASTNLALPLGEWTNLGPAVESPVGSGVFQFTDSQATNYPKRFYCVHFP